MDKNDEQKFKDLIHQAVQAGKQETSGLVSHLESRIDSAVSVAVDKYVNGRIASISQKLDDYIISDLKWKERAEPVVVAFERTTWLSSIVIQVLKMLGLLGAAVTAYLVIRNFFK